jgi:TP901 family phage tail tape measure protein
LKLSETIWKLNLVDNVREKLAAMQGVADKTRMHMENLDDKLGSLGKGGKASMMELSNELPGVGSRITQFITNPYVAATAAVIGLAAEGTKLAMEFETGMSKVNATAKLNEQDLGKLRNQLMDIGAEGTGGNLMRLPEAFEKINSQVNNVDASMAMLKVAKDAAMATGADITVVSDGLAKSMSSIGLGNATAEEVMDTLLKSKELGAGEMNDFATYLPGLIASGKNLGVAYQDVAGQFAYMTSKGQDAASSSMLIQNAYSALGKGDVQAGLKGIGVNVFDEGGTIRSFDAIFGDLAARTSTLNDEQKSQLFESMGLVDMQAKQAFSVLMNDSTKLGGVMDGVKNSAGTLEEVLKATNTPSRQLANLGEKFKLAMMDIGYAVLPTVMAIITFIGDGVLYVWNVIKGWTFLLDLIKVGFWLIKTVVDFVMDAVKLLGDLIYWVYEHTLKPIVDAFMEIWETIKKILGLSGTKIEIDAKHNITTTPPTAPGPAASTLPGMTNDEIAKKLKSSSSSGASKKVDGIHGGGSQVRNVTVTIHKLQDSINIHATTVREGAQDMRRIIQEELVRAINGAELAISNG